MREVPAGGPVRQKEITMAGSKGSWGKTQEAMESQGSGTFLRLENDGDKAVIALCGGPFPRDLCFNSKTNSYEAWDQAAKDAGRKKVTRYAMNAYATSVKGAAVNEMKVLDMNFNTVTSVIALKDKYGLSKCLFEITRHGAAGDTKTTYQILPDADITAEQRGIFGTPDPKDPDGWIEGTVKLFDLEEVTAKDGSGSGDSTVTDDVKKAGGKKATEKPVTPATNGTTASPANANGSVPNPISKETATEIIGKLKPLDKDKGIVPFLARFPYAKKVSEILASDEASAREYANKLAGVTTAAGEDPFA